MKKFKTVNNSINIKKINNYLFIPQTIEQNKQKLETWQWKSRLWLGTDTKMWQG